MEVIPELGGVATAPNHPARKNSLSPKKLQLATSRAMRSTLISDLNITWLRDANVNKPMNRAPAVAWADNFSFGGYSDWRLPTSDQCLGYSCRSSEMAHLFYVEWGNIQGASAVNSGDFQNVQNAAYGSGTTLVSNPSDSLFFYPTGGNQRSVTQNSNLFAMAVRDGDVIATVPGVPEPETYALMLLGLAGVAFATKRRARGLS